MHPIIVVALVTPFIAAIVWALSETIAEYHRHV